MRSWSAERHFFPVCCDDRRVLWNGESFLLSEIVEHFNSKILFEAIGRAKHHDKVVAQEVAETDIVLHRSHSAVIDGRKRQVTGDPLPVRLVITRLLDEQGYIVAE